MIRASVRAMACCTSDLGLAVRSIVRRLFARVVAILVFLALIPLSAAAQTPTNYPLLELSTSPLAFANLAVGTQSPPQTLTVTSDGNAALVISSISIIGANASDFAISNSSTCPVAGTTMQIQTTCTVVVTFTPTATGDRAAALSIVNNSPTPMETVPLISYSPAEPVAVLTPATLSFMSSQGPNQSKAVVLTNVGSADLSVTASTLTVGTYFTVYSTCDTALAPGANCSFLIIFASNVAGSFTASLNISDNAPETTQSVALTGLYFEESNTGAATVSPPSLTFAGPDEPAQTVTLTNTGGTPLGIIEVVLEDGVDYTVSPRVCDVFLAPGGTCEISVTFTPSAGGTDPSTLTFYDTATTTPQVVQLNPTVAPTVTLTPSALSFVGTSSPAQSATLTNSGTAALAISGISSNDSVDFPVTSTCGSSLAAGTSCQISVLFTPTTTGTFSAILSVTDGTPASTQTVSLTGDAISGPGAAVTPAALHFVGDAGLPQEALLTNNGGTALNIASITTTDTAHFATLNNCAASLAPGATCLLNVLFTPTADGTVNSTISIADNSAGSPQVIALTGTSGAEDGPGATVFPGVLTIGTLPSTATLTNTGNSMLAISSIATNTATYVAGDNCGTNLAAGASCVITVSPNQGIEGALPANPELSITDNAVGSPQTVALEFNSVSGSGPDYGDPLALATPGSLAFFRSGGPAQVITLINPAPPDLYFSGATLSTNANFSVSNNCPATLVSSASCQITVSFVSGPAGTVTNSVIISDNAGGPQVIPITGTNPSITGTGSGGGAELLLGAATGSLTSATATSGQTATFDLQAVQTGAGSAAVALSVDCSTVPGTTCTASPDSITVNPAEATTFSVSVATTPYSAGSAPSSTPAPHGPPLSPGKELRRMVAALLVIVLLSLVAIRRFGASPARWVATTAALMLLVIASGCAGGGTGNGGGSTNPTGTPSGTYTIILTAKVQGATQKLNLTLTVQ